MASSNTSNGASVVASTKETVPNVGQAPGHVAATGAFASRAKLALDAWQTLENALASVSEHAQVFSHVAEAVDRHVTMEIEMQNKDARVARLQSTIQDQFDELTKRFDLWAVEKTKLEEEVGRVKTTSDAKIKDVAQKIKASHVHEVEKLKKALDCEKKKSAALESKLEDANEKIKKAEEGFAKCKKEVDEWDSYMSELREVDFKKLDAKIKPLSERCCTIARNHFFCDLPERLFQDHSQWDTFRHTLKIPLTFPPSNSPVAKTIRTAASLHMIARTLCTEIFKPTYIPSSPAFAQSLKEILATQFLASITKERITRALVLGTYSNHPEDIDDAVKDAARAAAAGITKLLAPIGAGEAFKKDVEGLFADAAEAWRGMAQYSVKMVEALTEDDIPDYPWVTLDEFNIPNTPTPTNTNTTNANNTTNTVAGPPPLLPAQDDMLNLFPRIYVPEDDEVVFSGITLLYSQGIAAAAEKEFNECLLARRQRSVWSGSAGGGGAGNVFLGGGGGTRRERRMSSLADGKAGFPTLALGGGGGGGGGRGNSAAGAGGD